MGGRSPFGRPAVCVSSSRGIFQSVALPVVTPAVTLHWVEHRVGMQPSVPLTKGGRALRCDRKELITSSRTTKISRQVPLVVIARIERKR